MIEPGLYNNKELALSFGIDPNMRNLKRTLTTTLQSAGLVLDRDFTFPKRGYISIINSPREGVEEVFRTAFEVGFNNNLNIISFSIFVFCLLEDDEFQRMPWEVRGQYLKKHYNIDASRKTLYNWVSSLIDLDLVIKDTSEFDTWVSKVEDNVLERRKANEEELERLKEFNKEFFGREDIQKMDNDYRKKVYFNEMYNRFGGKFYKCYGYIFGAWNAELLDGWMDAVRYFIEINF